MTETYDVLEHNPLTLTCNATGVPFPLITWHKNSVPIHGNTSNYHILDDGIHFDIVSAQQDHTARFTCEVENVAGVEDKYFDVNVLGKMQSDVVSVRTIIYFIKQNIQKSVVKLRLGKIQLVVVFVIKK